MYHRLDQPISATFQHRQVLALRQRGIEVSVLCPIPYRVRAPRRVGTNDRLPDLYELDGVEVGHAVYRSPPLKLFPGRGVSVLSGVLAQAILEIRESFPFDLIHAVRLYPTAVAALDAAQAIGVPLVGAAAGSDVHTHPKRGPAWRALTVAAIASCDQIVSVSEGLAREILDLESPPRGIRVVYNGVDPEVFAPPADQADVRRSLGLPAEGVGVCMVSRLVKEKGLAELASAFRRVAERYPSAWLAVVGDGSFRSEFERGMADAGLADRLFLPGAQSNSDVPQWMQASDVFVLPSHNEGLPNVVLEAMAVGLPTVATDVGGTAEAVEEGKTGFLVPPKEVDTLAERLLRLVGDEQLRSAMGSAGRARALKHFTWERSAETLEDVYRDAIRTHREGSHR